MQKSLFLSLSLFFAAQFASAETIAEFFVAYAKAPWKIERSKDAAIKGQWDAQFQASERKIMLSRNADKKTLYHELGHYYQYSLVKYDYELQDDRYSKEGGVEIFAQMLCVRGDMRRALRNAQEYCTHSRLVQWIADIQKVSFEEADKTYSWCEWYQIDWDRAQGYALKLYNSDFGKALQRLHNKRTKIGV
jgi:hypothetical protein